MRVELMKQIANEPVVDLRTVGIALTLRCNFQCAHCITESGPENRQTIDKSQALALIDRIACESENICFTGGESFLRRNDLFVCIARARELGLNVSAVTNGFWAKNDEQTRETLHRLAECGLSGICISLDRFHLPFVEPSNALRIARLCQEYGLNHLIRVCATVDDEFAEELINPGRYPGVNFQRVRVLKMGRAVHLPAHSFKSSPEFPDGCCSTVRSPIVLPGGLVQACCGPGVHFREKNPLNLGNWKNEDLSTILRRARTSPLVMALYSFGPKRIAELLDSVSHYDNVRQRPQYTGICELCVDMCNQENTVAVMERVLCQPEMSMKLIASIAYQQSFRYLDRFDYMDLPE